MWEKPKKINKIVEKISYSNDRKNALNHYLHNGQVKERERERERERLTTVVVAVVVVAATAAAALRNNPLSKILKHFRKL